MGSICASQEPDRPALPAVAEGACLVTYGTAIPLKLTGPLPPGTRPLCLRHIVDQVTWRNYGGCLCLNRCNGDQRTGEEEKGSGNLHEAAEWGDMERPNV